MLFHINNNLGCFGRLQKDIYESNQNDREEDNTN